MSNYNLTKMAVDMYCPGNVVQLDDVGQPSILVYIPAFKNSDVLTGGDDNTHPAFIVNGKEIAGFYYSKYQNVVHNGRAYSLPAEDPAVDVNFDTAREACEAKGYGWHMSTAAEWAAIALWCKKNGFLPYGNNDAGKDSRETDYKAIPANRNNDGATDRVATGTGPLTWSHDQTTSGVWDMNGNIAEWQSGIRVVWGEIQILANNDAADPDNPQNATSACWKAINAADGSLVEPESKTTDSTAKLAGNTVKMDYINYAWVYSTAMTNVSSETRTCVFGALTADNTIGDAAKVLLRALALLPDSGETTGAFESDMAYWNNGAAERFVYRGGSYSSITNAGLFYVSSSRPRSGYDAAIGFRAAYIPYI